MSAHKAILSQIEDCSELVIAPLPRIPALGHIWASGACLRRGRHLERCLFGGSWVVICGVRSPLV